MTFLKPDMDSLPDLSIINGPTSYFQLNPLHRIFEKIASNKEDKTALIYEDEGITRKYSYKEINELSNQLSRVLRATITKYDISRNSDDDYIVAVSMYPSERMVITLLAIWKCGAAYLPLEPNFPKPRVEHIIEESRPAIVIYDEDSSAFLDTYKYSYDYLLQEATNYENTNLSESECLQYIKDDLAIVMYTSGSTGIPKGVRIPHKVILNRLQWQFKTFPYSKTEKIGVFKTALAFGDSVVEIWGPLSEGLAILIVPKTVTQDPQKLVALLENYKIERLVLVPSHLKSLLMYLQLQKEKNLLSSLKLWMSSGETLAVSLANEFYQYFREDEYKLCNFYGSIEIMADVTYHVINGIDQLQHQDNVPIGLPIDNTIIYILDSDYRPVKIGDVGELFVSGLNLAAGYVNGRDSEKFIANPLSADPTFDTLYRTGDFAKVEKGTITYAGRTDSQIKIRGYRVDISEVEKAINSIDEVEKSVVLCYKPGEVEQALFAFVTAESSVDESHLEDILMKKLVEYMVPQVFILEDIPLMWNGKIDRQTLLRNYENCNNSAKIDYTDVPQYKTKAAQTLFETVAFVLNRSVRSTIRINSNFYTIGGNSLNTLYVITALSEKGFYISITDFISAKDFEEILDKMKYCHSPSLNAETNSYTFDILKDEYKSDVINTITSSFYEKASICILKPRIFPEDYTELLNGIWEPLVEKRLSFVARNENGEIHGVALNFDAREKPEVEITSKLTIIFEFLESIEGPIRDNVLPPGKGQVLHAFMMGTLSTLSPKENVSVMNFMEGEVIKLARERKFAGILATNTSPLTQQLGTVYGYETLHDCQVNKYVASDNTKPFGEAPDSQLAKVQWITF